jgi:hypothetical protein
MKDFSIRFNYNLATELFGTTRYYILRGEIGEGEFIQSRVSSINHVEDPSRK